jgi:hypothetical protein
MSCFGRIVRFFDWYFNEDDVVQPEPELVKPESELVLDAEPVAELVAEPTHSYNLRKRNRDSATK